VVTSKSRLSLSDALFSGVQRRVLGLLFGQPAEAFHGNDIVSRTASGRGAVRRELDRLTAAGLVTVTPMGNQKRYQANAASPIFAELCAIVQKTFGLADELRLALEPVSDRISLAYIYGSVAKQTDTARSDVDVLIVSDALSYQELMGVFEDTEIKVGRKINPNLFNKADYKREASQMDSFIARLLEQPLIPLIGEPHAGTKPGKPRKNTRT
jgi:predicted nucleotidyltransferase